MIVSVWYDELEFYNYTIPGYSTITKHFTQIIWKDTCEMGYAKIKGKENSHVFIVLYYPKGNIASEYEENVLPPIPEDKLNALNDEEFAVRRYFTQKSSLNQRALNKHNEYRCLHDCLPLEWSKTLESEAQEWINTLEHKDRIKLKPYCRRGQNIGFEWGKNL